MFYPICFAMTQMYLWYHTRVHTNHIVNAHTQTALICSGKPVICKHFLFSQSMVSTLWASLLIKKKSTSQHTFSHHLLQTHTLGDWAQHALQTSQTNAWDIMRRSEQSTSIRLTHDVKSHNYHELNPELPVWFIPFPVVWVTLTHTQCWDKSHLKAHKQHKIMIKSIQT